MSDKPQQPHEALLDALFSSREECLTVLNQHKITTSRLRRWFRSKRFMRKLDEQLRMMEHMRQLEIARGAFLGSMSIFGVSTKVQDSNLSKAQKACIMILNRLSHAQRPRPQKLTEQEQENWLDLLHPNARPRGNELIERLEAAQALYDSERGLDARYATPPLDRPSHKSVIIR